MRLQQWRYSDYGPYNYRYRRGGSYYETNRYGAEMLQRAIRDGYSEGFNAGQADRQDGYGFNAEKLMPTRTRATATMATTWI